MLLEVVVLFRRLDRNLLAIGVWETTTDDNDGAGFIVVLPLLFVVLVFEAAPATEIFDSSSAFTLFLFSPNASKPALLTRVAIVECAGRVLDACNRFEDLFAGTLGRCWVTYDLQHHV